VVRDPSRGSPATACPRTSSSATQLPETLIGKVLRRRPPGREAREARGPPLGRLPVNPILWELGDGLRGANPHAGRRRRALRARSIATGNGSAPGCRGNLATKGRRHPRVHRTGALASEHDREGQRHLPRRAAWSGPAGMRVGHDGQPRPRSATGSTATQRARAIVTRTVRTVPACAFEELGLHRGTAGPTRRAHAQPCRRRTPGHDPRRAPARENGWVEGGFVDLVTYGILDRRMAGPPPVERMPAHGRSTPSCFDL
jgi:hypothetical protein